MTSLRGDMVPNRYFCVFSGGGQGEGGRGRMARRAERQLRGGEGWGCNNVWDVYLVVEKKCGGLRIFIECFFRRGVKRRRE